jgi:8-oxo-dGTP pyrophosphatase MutT (NUDIX family)
MTVYNVFQKGLIRGSERLPFDPDKSYAYVEHPTEGWRVFLRTASFLYRDSDNPMKFLVVKKRGTANDSKSWEPPKGQMEGKDLLRNPRNLQSHLQENALREIEEESHIYGIKNLKYTGLVYQNREKDYPEKWYFQYHIFHAKLTESQINQSFDTFEWITVHPEGFDRWKRDRKEKDAVAWYSPTKTRMNPRWCPQIVSLWRGWVNK